MKKGEKAIIISAPFHTAEGESENSYPYNCPKDQKTTFIVELIDFVDKEKEKWDYSKEERVPVAAGFKEEGTKAFKAKDMAKAKEWYEKAVDYLEMNEDEEAVKLSSSIRLNLSLIFCREGTYDKAIEHANEVIKADEKSLKGYFRRAQAYYAKKDFNSAKIDLNIAFKLDEKNKSVISLFKKVYKALKDEQKREKNIYSQLFN